MLLKSVQDPKVATADREDKSTPSTVPEIVIFPVIPTLPVIATAPLSLKDAIVDEFAEFLISKSEAHICKLRFLYLLLKNLIRHEKFLMRQ